MQKKIKLLHFTSSLKMGGAEAVLCDLISSMDKDSFEHIVLYIHDGPHKVCLETLGVRHYQIKYGPLFFMHLVWCIKKIQPDIIHTLLWAANIAGRIAGRLLRVPVVSAWHNNLDQDGALRNLFDRTTCGMVAQHIAVSQGVIDSAQKLNFTIKADKVCVIANGIHTKKIRDLSAQAPLKRSDLGLTEVHFIVGSVGRFMPVKRYDLMLQAFVLVHRQFNQARLVLVGVGDQEDFLRAQATDLRITHAVIFIVGKSSAPYYPLFDCFSLSSDKEGVSIALLEAMSFGLPCVVTHADARHAVIEQGINGLLVPAGDAQKLAQFWSLLIADKEMAHKIGAAGYDHVRSSFSSERMCLEYETAFRKILTL